MPPSAPVPEQLAARLASTLGLDPRVIRARDGREHHLFRVQAPAGTCTVVSQVRSRTGRAPAESTSGTRSAQAEGTRT